MSGGAFEYKEYQLDYLADEIECAVEEYDNQPDLQKYAKRLANRLRKLRKEIKKLDYYLSSDCSEYKYGGDMSNTLVYVVYEDYGDNNYSRPIAVYANKKDALKHCTDKGLMYREMEVEE